MTICIFIIIYKDNHLKKAMKIFTDLEKEKDYLIILLAQCTEEPVQFYSFKSNITSSNIRNKILI